MPDPPSNPNPNPNQNPVSKQPGWQSGLHYPNPPDPESAKSWRSGPQYPNPPDPVNPDPLTLRDQWLFATRRYSRWYSRAWGSAILVGGALFFIGWTIKGSNPLPSSDTVKHEEDPNHDGPGESNKYRTHYRYEIDN